MFQMTTARFTSLPHTFQLNQPGTQALTIRVGRDPNGYFPTPIATPPATFTRERPEAYDQLLGLLSSNPEEGLKYLSFKPSVFDQNPLAQIYYKSLECTKPELLSELMTELQSKILAPDEYPLSNKLVIDKFLRGRSSAEDVSKVTTSLIKQCGTDYDNALWLLDNIRSLKKSVLKQGLNADGLLDNITYNTMIAACANARKWQEALRIFDSMDHDKVLKNTITYNTMIVACTNARKWQEAFTILKKGIDSKIYLKNLGVNYDRNMTAFQIDFHVTSIYCNPHDDPEYNPEHPKGIPGTLAKTILFYHLKHELGYKISSIRLIVGKHGGDLLKNALISFIMNEMQLVGDNLKIVQDKPGTLLLQTR